MTASRSLASLSAFTHNPQEELLQLLSEADHQKYANASQAESLATRAHVLAISLGDERSQAVALTILGACAFYQSAYNAALEHQFQARELSQGRFPDVELRVTNGLSVLHHQLGDYAQAMTYALESLELVHLLGDIAGEARVLSNMGNMHWEIQEYDRALELHVQARERLQELSQVHWTPAVRAQGVIIRLNTAVAAFHLKQYQHTLQQSVEILAQCQELQLHQPEAILRTYRALTFLELGESELAEQECEHALTFHRAGGDRDHEAMTLIARGRLQLQLGQTNQAIVDLQQALLLARDLQLRLRESEAHRWLSAALEQSRAFDDALQHFKAFYLLQQDLHDLTMDRKTKILTVQAKVVSLQREAALERDRRAALEQINDDLRRTEENVRHLAHHDELTGLPNRKLLMERLGQALKIARRTNARHGVMFIDLDGFKRVNDTLGHSSGDVMLQEVAARLRCLLRDSDTLARMAGDEFVVLAHDITDSMDLQMIANRIVEALQVPFAIAGVAVQVGASVGYACYPEHATELDGLLHCADTAMYQAKRQGKNQACAYRP
ncbi:tetratricopeptide repeat-containing diguanylate cyclase [Deinococcus humi]|uniref:Diguanylate cyclase (GGDEF)-like protein n=1 Tax=Deinococcus humi TaxID=662880 RepID=A0A7W8JWA2_9DEIO|nr:tetratricopeptide repeat-containing diguanylate cyclase [Deinococcus humi]MBB5364165.1 diguanylate cyclase (GGDEF)-like protein [Deinococcus humi]GGO38685.1 hypothetical protein GCM10008949_45640 [Deinococcus humi]